MKPHALIAAAAAALSCTAGHAGPAFVNGLAIDGTTLDASGGSAVNDGRLGFFSDLYYDPQRDEWWALSDCGPGGGTLRYETRIHRFRLDVDPATGAISNFQVLKTLVFRKGGTALDGFAPDAGGPLGAASIPRASSCIRSPGTCWCPTSTVRRSTKSTARASSCARSRRRPTCCRATPRAAP